jgi:hypothetical protein
MRIIEFTRKIQYMICFLVGAPAMVFRYSDFIHILILYQKSANGEGEEGEEDAAEEEMLEDEQLWDRLEGEVIRVTLQPNDYGFGISLAGIRMPRSHTKFPTIQCVIL